MDRGSSGAMSETKYKLILHKKAFDEIKALPNKIKKQVQTIIDGLVTNPTPYNSVRLKGTINAYRIRVSDYRIVYEIHATEIVVYVIGVAHRKEVYKRILRRGK